MKTAIRNIEVRLTQGLEKEVDSSALIPCNGRANLQNLLDTRDVLVEETSLSNKYKC